MTEIERNKALIEEYPFLMPEMYNGEEYDYTWTPYDWFPTGWRKAFGKNFLNDMKEAVEEDGCSCVICEIKEKFGSLRIYVDAGKKANYVASRYELLSLGYCVNCGAPARFAVLGYNLCEKCTEKTKMRLTEEGQKRIKRLTKEDIPIITSYASGVASSVDIKEHYKIDFLKIWGIEEPVQETIKA